MTDTRRTAGAADLLFLTADIVVAFQANNKLYPVAVPEVFSATMPPWSGWQRPRLKPSSSRHLRSRTVPPSASR